MCVFWPRKKCPCLSRKPPLVLALFTLGLASCWRSSLAWSGRRQQPPSRNMEWCTTLKLTVGLFLPKLGAWSQPRGRLLKRNSPPWKKQVSFLSACRRGRCRWWPCGDYHRLNTITVPDRYPLPNLMDLSTNMDSCMVFSKIDLVKAFHQVPIASEDRQKTAVITPFGLFEYNYMPFGLCNAAQTLQR
jgi:hypothetical protein